ncbi:PaaI family thioesterase [Duganella sp. HH105]|uniref:PaaI family thioesterase n=1 Tax=Duganella sp. HH105 TaxID=1781067 RepID=UPI000877E841|nr:PaaI family thioesterase [Duganella sp. HH105]OEZ56142.1 thioesterase superfamily protein [Duganella sp. HH105]
MTNATPMLASVEQLNVVLAESAFLAPYGFSVRSCEPGQCTLIVPFSASLERPGGIVSGMTIMGAADVAMWLAIMTQRGTGEHWVTTDMKTAFLRSARQENVVCVARILKLGKRTVYGTAECSNERGELLAHHVISYARVGD